MNTSIIELYETHSKSRSNVNISSFNRSHIIVRETNTAYYSNPYRRNYISDMFLLLSPKTKCIYSKVLDAYLANSCIGEGLFVVCCLLFGLSFRSLSKAIAAKRSKRMNGMVALDRQHYHQPVNYAWWNNIVKSMCACVYMFVCLTP